MKFCWLLISLSFLSISCGKDGDSAGTASTGLSEEATLLATISDNVASGGEGALTDVSGVPGAALFGLGPMAVGFDAETGCKASGQLDETQFSSVDALFPMYNIYCLLHKRPDGPDTVRGVIDRTSGWLCATGNIKYNGVAVTKTITISTKCFSQGFVDQAVQVVPTATFDAVVTGYDSVSGVAPAGFSKYFTFVATMPDGSELVNYTIAVLTTGTERAIAVLDTDSTTAANSAVFAVHMSPSTGVMKIEGRFPEHNRHFRFHMVGSLSASYKITNVLDLHFVNGETSDYQSLSGTPAAGRFLKYDNYALGLGHAGNDQCYGEAGATCTGNTGIVIANGASAVYSLASGHTTSSDWFLANSFLGITGALTVDPDADIWP